MRSETSFELDRDPETIGYSAVTGIRPTVTRTATADEHGYLVQLVELTTLGVTMPTVHVKLDFNIEIRPAERRILVEGIAPT